MNVHTEARRLRALQDVWDAPHICNFGIDYFSVEHPLSCQDMTACAWNEKARRMDGPPHGESGRYVLDGSGAWRRFEGPTPRDRLIAEMLKADGGAR